MSTAASQAKLVAVLTERKEFNAYEGSKFGFFLSKEQQLC